MEAHVTLAYYEAKSVVDMFRRLPAPIAIDERGELHYLTKTRDRYLSHVTLGGVQRRRGSMGGSPSGFPQIQVGARSNHWSPIDSARYGLPSEFMGSKEWYRRQEENERLVRSSKLNERLTLDERHQLALCGLRTCNADKALHELAEILTSSVVPQFASAVEHAISDWGFTRGASVLSPQPGG
jgi:hypothetical protein